MNKLFIFQDGSPQAYRHELEAAFQKVGGERLFLKEGEGLTIDQLLNASVDVVVSNGLSKEIYYILKGLGIVTITIDSHKDYYGYADIVIDHLSDDSSSYFSGREYSILGNDDFEIRDILELIKKLEWDSDFFGYNVAYLSCMHLTDNIYSRIEQFIKKGNIRLVEYLCNCHDSRSVKVAEKNNFHFTDIRLTFSKKLTDKEKVELPSEIEFKLAKSQHVPVLKEISKDLYKDSRYVFDKNFSPEKAREFYQNWVEKGALGTFDDECWCFFEKDVPFAFCTIKYGKPGSASIGLFGLDRRYQGRGFGKKLLFSVFNNLLEKNIDRVNVVTQGRNYAAQQLYQSTGFRTKTTQLWYHKWR